MRYVYKKDGKNYWRPPVWGHSPYGMEPKLFGYADGNKVVYEVINTLEPYPRSRIALFTNGAKAFECVDALNEKWHEAGHKEEVFKVHYLETTGGLSNEFVSDIVAEMEEML